MRALLELFYPTYCLACGGQLTVQEPVLCINCRHELPVAPQNHTTPNAIHKLLLGRVNVEQAAYLFYFDKKSKVQQLMHNLKYRGQEKISGFLGNWLGDVLSQEKAFDQIDLVVPVPLHRKRLLKRGYNQVDGFGKALAENLGCPYETKLLYRKKATRTQVFLGRTKRSSEILDSFEVNNINAYRGKHILLVDDLITTGGTAEGCALALVKIPDVKISIAVMALAR